VEEGIKDFYTAPIFDSGTGPNPIQPVHICRPNLLLKISYPICIRMRPISISPFKENGPPPMACFFLFFFSSMACFKYTSMFFENKYLKKKKKHIKNLLRVLGSWIVVAELCHFGIVDSIVKLLRIYWDNLIFFFFFG